MITSELFTFEPAGRIITVKNGKKSYQAAEHRLLLGSDKRPVGELRFKADRPYEKPDSITSAKCNGRWSVSFNLRHGGPDRTAFRRSTGAILPVADLRTAGGDHRKVTTAVSPSPWPAATARVTISARSTASGWIAQKRGGKDTEEMR
jgi:hypothetical protein